MTPEEKLAYIQEGIVSHEEALEHFGVKGMRWGVRKRPVHKVSGDAKKAAEIRRKPVSSLTNKQLKILKDRVNLEQTHRQLNPSKIAKGRKHATEVLATIGVGVSVYNLVKSPAGQAAILTAKKALGK